MFKTTYLSPVGKLVLLSDGERLSGVLAEKQVSTETKFIEKNNIDIFNLTKSWFDRYFNKEKPEINELPLSLSGTEFQKAVWQELCKIPYGKTTTYGEIAKHIALSGNLASMSAQAVGGAVGANKFLIIIPCHRVIGKNGKLTGFAGGLEMKAQLLELEKTYIE